MDNKVALQIINEALNIAISKGCYGLVEVINIVKALDELTPLPDFSDITED